MITYCSHCKINWASLWTDCSGEDIVEFCPECKSDMFLEDGNDFVCYVKSPYDGSIREVGTNKELETKQKIRVKLEEIKVWDESWQEFELRKEQAEDEAIDLYLARKTAMIKSVAVERKYHIEQQYIPCPTYQKI
jgi:hypothetical protein